MLASIVENAGVVTVIATAQDDTIVISSATPGFTDISINFDQHNAVFGSFASSDIQNVLVFAGDGDDSVYSSAQVPTEINGQGGNDILNGGSSDDILRGSFGDDIINGRLGDDVISGGDGRDRLSGADGADSIFGQTGDDVINGHGGDDFISGGDGNDIVVAGNGNDRVFGGLGDDNISGNAGEDVIYGGEGNDRIDGGTGDDFLAGNQGDDSLFGEGGNDNLNGSTGDDFLVGGTGNDSLDGMEGLDQLFGGGGNDHLEGGFETDIDQLNCGSGSDTFIQRDNDVLQDVSSAQLDTVLDARGSVSGDGSDPTNGDGGSDSDDDDDSNSDLAVLVGLFGPTLTDTVSGVVFAAAAQALGDVETFGNVSVLTVGPRKVAFQDVTSSGSGSFGGVGVAPDVTLIGSFPATINSDFGLTLASYAQPSVSTAHVIGTTLVVVGGDGSAANVAAVDGAGTISPFSSSINLPDFDILLFVNSLAGGGEPSGIPGVSSISISFFHAEFDGTNSVEKELLPATDALRVSNFVTNDELPARGQTNFETTTRDHDNFRLQVTAPDVDADSIDVTVQIVRDGVVVGDATELEFTHRQAGEAVYRSDVLRLVSNEADDERIVVFGNSGDPSNQTILVQLGDTVRVSYDGVTNEMQVGRPSNEDGPEAIRFLDVVARVVYNDADNDNEYDIGEEVGGFTEEVVKEHLEAVNTFYAQAFISIGDPTDVPITFVRYTFGGLATSSISEKGFAADTLGGQLVSASAPADDAVTLYFTPEFRQTQVGPFAGITPNAEAISPQFLEIFAGAFGVSSTGDNADPRFTQEYANTVFM